MRTVTIYRNAIAPPGVCAKCGSQDRDWFVDLGFSTNMEQRIGDLDIPIWVEDAVVYLCCECINGLMDDIQRAYDEFAPVNDITVPYKHGTNDCGSISIDPTAEPDDREAYVYNREPEFEITFPAAI